MNTNPASLRSSSLRSAAITALSFDADIRAAFVLATKDELLNAAPRASVLAETVSAFITALVDYVVDPAFVDEQQVSTALDALNNYGDELAA